jgi:predicted transcriptional regulator
MITDNQTNFMRDEYDFDGAQTNLYLHQSREQRCLEIGMWRIKEIEQALTEADEGEFVSAEDFINVVKKYTN